ncbi:MAG: cupin domain-containing protein [Acidobacteriota bacterium]
MRIVNLSQAAVIDSAHGSQIRPLIDRTTAPITQCSLAEETLPPGHTVARHRHNVLEEIYLIVSGSGRIRLDKEERVVGPGDAVYIPRQTYHELTNTGQDPMKILLVCGPAYFAEDHRVDD